MSSTIRILPDHVINKIAAGEVVERPASVVKELIENSIDADATEIFVDIEQAGKRLIRITDNGRGMPPEDVRIAFDRHATSKITSDEDLLAVRTMGFRGEALSSIASVSRVRIVTSTGVSASGSLLEIEGGVVKGASDTAATRGTSLEISDLFYNTPARLKFMKSPATELSHIVTAVSRQAMSHPSIRFRLTHNRKPVLDLPASMSLKDRLFQMYGSEIAENVIEFSGARDPVRIRGLLGRPGYTRADKTYQDFYVNRRAVKNASLSHALYAAFADMLMRERHPVGFIFIDIDPLHVDVNVHPAKSEVRFRNQSQVHDAVRDVIREGLRGSGTPVSGTTEARIEGVKEAVSDYLKSSESGVSHPAAASASAPVHGIRSSELPLTPALSPEGRGNCNALLLGRDESEVKADSRFFASSSELRTRHSELLFPLAQIHDSFIVAQSREGMALIDQHAAHERVLFEKLQDQCESGNVAVQQLLIPAQVELGPAQSILLSGHISDLGELGFLVEDFGSGTFVIKGVPALLGKPDSRKLLMDILDEVNANGKSRRLDELRDGILSVMACHPAIKIHRKLDVREMEHLVESLFKCRMPHTCPHGRPTIINFSMNDIKKLFKRM